MLLFFISLNEQWSLFVLISGDWNIILKFYFQCTSKVNGKKDLISLAIANFDIPGEPRFPLNAMYQKPSNKNEAGKITEIMIGLIVIKDSGTFSKCPQIYIKLTRFEDNDSGKLPFKYYLLGFCSFCEMSKTMSGKWFFSQYRISM